MEEYVFQVMFEWLTSPTGEVNEEYCKEIDLESEDINYTVSFSENNRCDLLT
jgi:hypothetical protein